MQFSTPLDRALRQHLTNRSTAKSTFFVSRERLLLHSNDKMACGLLLILFVPEFCGAAVMI